MIIDSEFKSLIPPLQDTERAALEASLISEGCRDALVVWDGILLDGHNRYEICTAHNIPFATVERKFQDRSEALVWIIQNQLGRRNISDYTRGKLALRLEDALKAQAKNNMSAGGGDKRSPDAKSGLPMLVNPINAQAEIAKVAELSKGTIHKVKAIEAHAPEVIKQAAASDEMSIHRAYGLTRALETMKQANPKFYEETVARGHVMDLDGEDIPLVDADPTLLRVMSNEDDYERARRHATYKRGVPKALQMSESNEWYTPKQYIEAARALMGGIELDPASCELANEIVQADCYFDIQDDGLSKEWFGTVWLNPPYGRDSGDSNQALWSERLIEQYHKGNVASAVLLVNAVTDRQWFQPLWDYPICFTNHRIRFYDENGEAGQPTHGNAFVYFGANAPKFAELFRQFGVVVQRWGQP